MELQAIDWRMQDFNDLPPTSPIVHVDIDDGSLDRIGRWPWHRDVTAELISVLHELGAKQIMVDLLFSEPEQPYIDPELLTDESSAGPGDRAEAVIGELSPENLIEPDLELARAVRVVDRVIMAVQMDTIAPGSSPALTERLRRLRERSPEIDTATAMATLNLDSAPETRDLVAREMTRLRIRDRLLSNFTLDEATLGAALGVTQEEIAAVIAGVKRRVAEERVADELERNPALEVEDALRSIMGKGHLRHNSDSADIRAAYRVALGMRQLRKAAVDGLHGTALKMRASRAENIVPLHPLLAEAAMDIAAVSFRGDPDGVVRRVPILIDTSLGVIKHMGLAAAATAMGLDFSRARAIDPWLIEIPTHDGSDVLRLPLDGDGNLLIHWTRTAPRWRRGDDFPHVSAASAWSIADARRQIRQNERLKRVLMAEVVAASKGVFKRMVGEGENAREETIPADSAYRKMVNRHIELSRKLRRSELGAVSIDAAQRDDWAREAADLAAKISAEEEACTGHVLLSANDLASYSAEELESDEELRQSAARFLPARDIVVEKIPAIDRANEHLAAALESSRKKLSPILKDKHVFLGYAATAEGDIVATPIDPRTNGVMCHAHVLNSILQRSFIRAFPLGYGAAICLFLGAIVGLITATRGPALALGATVFIAAAYVYANAVLLFRQNGLLLPVVPSVLTMALSWAFVTLFRQLTAERDKRLFRKQLSQYTSPAIAAKIAESPEAARAFKAVQKRDLTCLFSDLKGFTTISEQENAEVVQHVLNVYLERMSEVIWEHRGMINKFMGDGIMAILNPSVDPLEAHPKAACETALDAIDALDQLKKDRIAGGDSPIFARLEMRLGMATGHCMNGDLGSELKADYTVIGDVVNLAARLEPANKVFGTSILVNGDLHDRVGDQYEFRYLAELQVKGKSRTTPVFELLGRRGDVDATVLEYARRFEAGVELYKQRRWDECIVHFTRILARRPDDAGAGRYIDACQELKTFPPGDDWAGALELKEK